MLVGDMSIAPSLMSRALAAAEEGLEPNLRRWLAFLGYADGDVIELQALHVPSGRYEESRVAHAKTIDQAIALAVEADRLKAQGLYLIANSVDPAVATRGPVGKWRVMPKGVSTTDNEIAARRVLFVDVDARRVKGTSSTREELAAALAVAEHLAEHLAMLLPCPTSIGVGMSGNGASVMVALDKIPESPELAATIKGVLAALGAIYSNERVDVDPSVCDAKRLAPAFGTWKRKGAGVEERPHRRTGFYCAAVVERVGLADLVHVLELLRADLTPEQEANVDRAMGKRATPTPTKPSASSTSSTSGDSRFGRVNALDVRDVAAHLGLVVGGDVTCPGCGTVGDSSVSIVGNGLKCMHARCADKGAPGRPGFRTPVDLVMEAHQVDARAAVEELEQAFGIGGKVLPLPQRSQRHAERTPDDGPPDDAQSITVEALSPTDIIHRWRTEGPLERVPTGIAALDERCRGGLPFPWRVMLVGAPSAGKTLVSVAIANSMARGLAHAGVAVGMLAVDEEPDDVTIRLLQIAGFTVDQAEERDPSLLLEMARAVAALPIRFYTSSTTIEAAGADLAEWASKQRKRAALFVDSIQTASSLAGRAADTARGTIEGNVAAVRSVATAHRMLVVATSEANRSSYRTQAAAEEGNDLAAGAESRAIEFGAQTQLVLRTPKGHADVVHVRVAKNRRAFVGEFWLKLDRERHTVEECENPCDGPVSTDDREQAKRSTAQAAVTRDARVLCELVRANPGIGERQLRARLSAAGHPWGRDRLDAAQALLENGHGGWRLIDRGAGTKGKPRVWHVEASREVEEETSHA